MIYEGEEEIAPLPPPPPPPPPHTHTVSMGPNERDKLKYPDLKLSDLDDLV